MQRYVKDSEPVIEINSSPEPVPPPRSFMRTRSNSSIQSTAAAKPISKGKGKAKEKVANRRVAGLVALGPVIELTDSESEVDPHHTRLQDTLQPEAGPSRPQARTARSTLRPKPVRPSASLENIPIPVASGSGSGQASSKKRTKPPRTAVPLFLKSQSDEENDPPVFGERPAKRVHTGDDWDIANDEDNDWDPEFANRVFPFPFLDEYPPEPLPVPVMEPTAPVPVPQPVQQVLGGGGLAPRDQPDHVPQAPAPRAVQPAPPAPAPLPAAPAPEVQPAPVAQAAAPPPIPIPIPSADPVIPDPEPDPTSRTIAQILEIIPDVEPEYLLGLVQTHLPDFAQQTVEHVLGLLFEDGGYPRADPKGKGKRKADEGRQAEEAGVGEDRPNKKVKVDYASVEREVGGPMYNELALVQLQISFPFIPKMYIRQRLQANRGLYAPTHLAFAEAEKVYRADAGVMPYPRPYNLKSTRFNPTKDRRRLKAVIDETFIEERRWLVEHLQDPNETDAMTVGAAGAVTQEEGEGQGQRTGNGKEKERAVEEAEEDAPVEEGTGIECQCCFAEYAFDKMVQCPEAHLFCSGCVSQYASTKLGEHDASIICMHESGCAQPFPPSELRRILSSKLMDLYERVKQQKEIQSAALEGLEECPFCEWKCVLDMSNEEEKLFRCGNEEGGCGVVSCRSCKKKDHLPKSCKEVEEDKLLDGRHAIEEAMTRALMRNCPKCHKAFVKDAGCNKMTCPNCRTLSCYVCRKVIAGYEHFNQTPAGRPTSSKAGGKCLLWDQVEERHAADVKAAAERAMEQYKRDHPDVDEKDIKVDLPVAPPPPQPVPPVAIAPPAVQYPGWQQHAQLQAQAQALWGHGGVQVQVNFPGQAGPVQPAYHMGVVQPPPPRPVRGARQVRAEHQQAMRDRERLLEQRQEQLRLEMHRQQQIRQQQELQRELQLQQHLIQQQELQQRYEQYRQQQQQQFVAGVARGRQNEIAQQLGQIMQPVQAELDERQRNYQDLLRRFEDDRARAARQAMAFPAPPLAPVVQPRAAAKRKTRR